MSQTLTSPLPLNVQCTALCNRLGCNYFVVSHETGRGLIATRGRGRPPGKKKKHQKVVEEEIIIADFPQDREKEIAEMRRSLFVKDDSTVLLLVSICTDAMIKLVAMHPEVWFMDVTSSVNKQKSDLFMLAIRTPSGRTFPGNFTFIPSGKSWVFQCIYQYAFTSLFGTTVCSYNRLALFDDDFSERGPYESCIATLPHFSKSKVMLCVFHAVWMPFQERVIRFITARFHDGSGLLTKLGKEIGA